jgi:hypothetical protein
MGFELNKDDENTENESGFSLDKDSSSSSKAEDTGFSLDKDSSSSSKAEDTGFSLDKENGANAIIKEEAPSADDNSADKKEQNISATQSQPTTEKSNQNTEKEHTTPVGTNDSTNGSEGSVATPKKSNKNLLIIFAGAAALFAVIFMLSSRGGSDINDPEPDRGRDSTEATGTVDNPNSGATQNTGSSGSTGTSGTSGNTGTSGSTGTSGNAGSTGSSVTTVASGNSNAANTVNTTLLSTLSQATLEEKARLVIQGRFGVGLERKRLLGSEYAVIQARVNEILLLKN